ncbi:MAG: threonine-phosphate decarboxylase CobD [Pseudomonadota bacterium]
MTASITASTTDDLLHGGAIDLMRQRFPDAPTPWIDLSTGINPRPFPHADVSTAAIAHLPTKAIMDACRHAMSDAINAPEESIVLAPGSELLIRILPSVLALRTVSVLTPSYGDHARVWRMAGATLIETDDPLAYADRADAVVVCNPNNPDGRSFTQDDLDAARMRLASRNGWLIVDEAYADLTPDLSLANAGGKDGLIILRSFGKFYGLAGLRLGAVLAPPAVRSSIATRLGVWPISGAALEIGTRAYNDNNWRNDARRKLQTMRTRLDRIFSNDNTEVVGGTDLFRFVRFKDAHAVWMRLAKQGVYVRRFDWSTHHLRFGLPYDKYSEDRLSKALSL